MLKNKVTTYPLVTVYITNFNYGGYIKKAIESVLQQSKQNFELIIIDDGSTDESVNIINEYSDNQKIKLIFQHNKGLNVTNNIAIKIARGRYIMRLDADDWLDSHAIELMSNYLERNPEVGLIFPDYYLVNSEGNLLEQVRRHSFDEVTLYDQPAHGACTMIRCEFLRSLGGYDETFSCQDGYDLWVRFIEHYKVKNINLPLFYYRQHGANLTGNEKRILTTRANIVSKVAKVKRASLHVLAVIVVRGRNVDPNCPSLKALGGKPLVYWTIKAACESEKIHKVVLSSPDEELLEYAQNLGHPKLEVVHRPAELARTNDPINATLRHALCSLKGNSAKYDAVFQLAIESPFRSTNDLNSAIDVMNLFGTDIVIGVRLENDNFFRHNGHGLVPITYTNRLRLERDELYREVGSMRLVRFRTLESKKETSDLTIGQVVFDQKSSIRLVSKFDWEIAEYLAANNLN